MLMTTSAGSEGISLRHVRDVHIMEPYWNRVRVDQVIGRARRVKSHLELVPEQHNVRVHEYVTTFDRDILTKSRERKKHLAEGNRDLEEPELFTQKMHHGVQKKGMVFDNYDLFLETYTGLFIEPDNGLTTDGMLHRDGMHKFRINKIFLDASRNVAIDCSKNAEHNLHAGRLKEGDAYTEIECISDGEYSNEYNPDIIRTARKDKDKYAFPLEMSGEEFTTNRQKRFKEVVRQTSMSFMLPIRNIRDLLPFWKLVGNKITVGMESLNANALFNLYAYIGLDPLFKSFKEPSMQFNPKTMAKCNIGNYTKPVPPDNPHKFHLKNAKLNISNEHIYYLVMLHIYVQKAWEYLKKDTKFTGSFTSSNKEAMIQIRTFISMGTKSKLPFVFTYQSKRYAYSNNDFYDIDLHNIRDKSPLMGYLKTQIGVLKLKYMQKAKQQQAKQQTNQSQQPTQKPTKNKTQLISHIPKPTAPAGKKRRKRGGD
jgi:hypothetical protein